MTFRARPNAKPVIELGVSQIERDPAITAASIRPINHDTLVGDTVRSKYRGL